MLVVQLFSLILPFPSYLDAYGVIDELLFFQPLFQTCPLLSRLRGRFFLRLNLLNVIILSAA